MSKDPSQNPTMDDIISLCKRRGFIFQSSEIYGGINGFYDYGPLGVELRKNIKDAWWQDMVHGREDIVGQDASIIMHPNVWRASGHVDSFSDPMVDCKESKLRYRADHLLWSVVTVDGDTIGYVSTLEGPEAQADAEKKAETLKRKAAKQGDLGPIELKEYLDATPDLYELIPSPATGKPGSLTPPREFNMMFQTFVGALKDESSVAYLRPETAQGIFANFKAVLDTARVKIPFGIAQIGKAFRNEITPKNFIFRSREFEQMEIEYFIEADEDAWENYYKEWIQTRMEWHKAIGLSEARLSTHVHPKNKLAHYSRACTDIMFEFPFGVQELEGIAARGNYDLTQHQEHSGKSMEYFDEVSREKYIPHVIEPSLGVDRTLLAVLCSAYTVEDVDGETRNVLKFAPRIAPIKAAIFPLMKNKPEIVEMSKRIYKNLSRRHNVFYDQAGAIGRRYRRMDEAGTPFCITVDFDSLEDGTVTLRDRDSMEQVRIPEAELAAYIDEKVYN
jgi:glycyl-tRNA synthetase